MLTHSTWAQTGIALFICIITSISSFDLYGQDGSYVVDRYGNIQPALYTGDDGSYVSQVNHTSSRIDCDGCYSDGCDCGVLGCDGCDSSCSDSRCKTYSSRGELQRALGHGFIKGSEECFHDFISPTTNPVYFEDPRQLTEIRPVFIHHRLATGLGSGGVSLIAIQARVRVAENVSIIAIKDGFISPTSGAPLDDGWADIAAGVKLSLLRDECKGCLLSWGLTYELPSGNRSALQGNGDGEFNTFLSYGRRIGEHAHWISTGGYRLPANSNLESQSLYWSNHFDYQVFSGVYLFTETNWFNWTKAGGGGFGLTGIEGNDLFNLGSVGVAGNDIITTAFGVKLKPIDRMELGVAWEFPATKRRDLLDNRFTVDMAIRY